MSLLSEPGGIVAVFPGGAVGMFGPRGFTRRPEVADVLDPFETGDPAADVIGFRGMPRVEVARLLALVPSNQADVSAPGAPTFAQLLSLTRRCASARFDGYRLSSRRLDERVVLDSVTLSGDDVTPACRRRLLALTPTVVEEHGHSLTVRWA